MTDRVDDVKPAKGRIVESRSGSVTILQFLNPPHGYMDEAMEIELAEAIERLDADEHVRAVVLTGGQHDVFVRHYDVAIIEARGRSLAARGLTFDPVRPVPEGPIHATLRRMESGDTAYVAAINGTAMGGGFELALACDVRLVQDGPYDLGLPEINLGILPGAGGTQRLPRLVGQSRAAQMTLLGDTLTPRQAFEVGLAITCTDGPVLSEAEEIAHRLARKPAKAFQHIKRLLRDALDVPPETGLATERTLFCDLMVSDDALTLMQDWTLGNRTIRDAP